MSLLDLEHDGDDAPPPYIFQCKNPAKAPIEIKDIHIDSSCDVFDSEKTYVGLIIYLCGGKSNFILNNVECRTGDIYIREVDWIAKNTPQNNAHPNYYHGRLFYSIFGCWKRKTLEFIAGRIAYHDGEWKLNSATLNTMNPNNNDDEYHDTDRKLNIFEKRLIQKVCNNLYTNHKWLEMSPETRVSIKELQKMNHSADYEKVHPDRRLHGTLAKYNYEKGYGFIKSFGFYEDIFVHYTEVTDRPVFGRYMTVGDHVEFNVIKRDRGWRAYNVTVIKSD